MIFAVIVVVATIVSAFAAHFLLGDPGYVVIEFRGYLIEMSVPVLVGLAALLVLVVALLVATATAALVSGEVAAAVLAAVVVAAVGVVL